jgi:hypothetical protein
MSLKKNISISKSWRNGLIAFGSAGALAITGLTVGAPAASASTIQNGWIQLCAQGDYPAFIHINDATIPNSNGETTGSAWSFTENPGSCTWFPFNTDGLWLQVDVVGIHSDGQQFYIDSYWWNSSTGLGIGAEGDQYSPWTQTW